MQCRLSDDADLMLVGFDDGCHSSGFINTSRACNVRCLPQLKHCWSGLKQLHSSAQTENIVTASHSVASHKRKSCSKSETQVLQSCILQVMYAKNSVAKNLQISLPALPLMNNALRLICFIAAECGILGSPEQGEVSAWPEELAVSAGGALRSCICCSPGGRSWVEGGFQWRHTAL